MAAHGDPLGVDVECTTGFPLAWRLVWGTRNLQCALLRRLNCDEGALLSIGDDGTYGYNLAAQLNNDWPRGEMASMNARVRAELEKDERVQNVTVRTVMGSG